MGLLRTLANIVRVGVAALLPGCASGPKNDASADHANARLEGMEFSAEAYRNMDRYFAVEAISAGTTARVLPQHARAGELNTAAFEKFNADNGTTGMLVVQGGAIVFEDYLQGATHESLFTSWSVAKSFTGVLTGVALHCGDIKTIDDPLTDYVPDLAVSAFEGVTVKDALTMSSGVAFDETYGADNGDVERFLKEGALAGNVNGFLRTLTERAHPRFTRFNYSTPDTQALGEAVERASGVSLAQYASENIWKPMGAEANGTWCLDAEGGDTLGGFCLNARLRDYARFGLFMLDDATADGVRYVAEGYVHEATHARAPHLEHSKLGEGTFGYGDQWWLMDEGEAYCAMGVFGQFLIVVPERDLVVVVTSAWDEAWDGERELALYAFLKAHVLDVLKP